MQYLLMILLLLTALFLILLVLVQRGKGGGLAGAFGGMGGQSAFGTTAGDLFTRITIAVAAFWIILCMITVRLLGTSADILESDMGGATQTKGGVTAPLSTEKESGPSQPAPAAPAKSGGSQDNGSQ